MRPLPLIPRLEDGKEAGYVFDDLALVLGGEFALGAFLPDGDCLIDEITSFGKRRTGTEVGHVCPTGISSASHVAWGVFWLFARRGHGISLAPFSRGEGADALRNFVNAVDSYPMSFHAKLFAERPCGAAFAPTRSGISRCVALK